MLDIKTEEESDYITLKFDLLFKKVFVDEKDLVPIKYLLKNILNEDISKVKILNSELIGRPYKDKNVQVDLVVELKCGTKVSVEINTNVSQEYINRNIYYMCRNVSKDLKPGKRHKNLNRHIQINIDYNGSHVKPIEKFSLIEEERGVKLTNMIEIIRVDIPYFREKCYNEDAGKLASLTKLMGLFGIGKLEIAKNLCKGDENMENIMNRIEKYNDDEDVIGAYNYEEKMELISQIKEDEAKQNGLNEGFKDGLEHGLERGIEQGTHQEKINIAKNMLKENANIDFISKVTGLTVSEIKKLYD